MERRTLLKRGALVFGAVAVGAPTVWVMSGPGSSDATSASARAALDRLEAEGLTRLRSRGAWSAAQVFVHVAQSIEYSISGYPELRSGLFRGSVGPVAFGAFAARGQLVHGRADAIPGAPALPDDLDPAVALQRLREAIDAFEGHQGTFQPHFAYGDLGRRDYEIAHVLHLRDHLVELEVG